MVKLKTITITRVEGLIAECNKPVTAKSFAEADAILRRWSNTAPEHGGYDKCDFKIEYEDGYLYEGRYDLVHWRKERPDLAGHVRSFVNYLAGIPPRWLKRPGKEKYLDHFNRECAANPDRIAEAKTWLETYEVAS